MQGGQHQVARHCGASGNLGGFLVADFTHQQNVGVLPQEGAEHARKGEVDFFIDLHLADAGNAIFDRILAGQYLYVALIELFQGTVQRGGLAGTGGPGHQYDPVGGLDGAAEFSPQILRHSRILQGAQALALNQQAHYDRLAMLRGNSRQTDVNPLGSGPDRDSAIRGQALFSDVQTGQKL